VIAGRRPVIHWGWRVIPITARGDCRAHTEADQTADDRGRHIIAVVLSATAMPMFLTMPVVGAGDRCCRRPAINISVRTLYEKP
jgi:hypothetical protein